MPTIGAHPGIDRIDRPAVERADLDEEESRTPQCALGQRVIKVHTQRGGGELAERGNRLTSAARLGPARFGPPPRRGAARAGLAPRARLLGPVAPPRHAVTHRAPSPLGPPASASSAAPRDFS